MKGSPAEQPQAQPLLWFQRPISNWRTRKRNSEAVPEIAAAASKKKDVVREVIVADQVSDLPPDIRKKVLAMGIPQDTLDMHFDILTTVMRFKLKHVFKTKAEAESLNQRREERATRRQALMKATSISKATPARAPTRARTLTVPLELSSQPAAALVEPRVLQWLAELDEVAEQTLGSDEEDAAADVSQRERIIAEGEKLCGQSEQQTMMRKYKGWDQSGKGGFGTVYMTKDSGAKSMVAVKVVPHKSTKEQATNFTEVYFLNRCRHPNVVTFFNAFVLPEEIWVIMEFLEGGTLTDAVKNRTFTEEEVAFVAREMIAAVKYLHEIDLAHRDIKSANVMMSVTAQIKLIDFGLCRDMKDGPQVHMLGSPYWMPPEMIRRHPHGKPVDLWSTGICLIELMDGKPPNKESSLKAMFLVGIGESPHPSNPNKWSFECRQFLDALLEIDPAVRVTAENAAKHPFMAKACSQKVMSELLRAIFVNKAFSGGGVGGGGGIF